MRDIKMTEIVFKAKTMYEAMDANILKGDPKSDNIKGLTEVAGIIFHLITTIESQKEKIIDLESQKALLDEVLPHLEVSGNIILKQQKEISSLKSITELAVKGLTVIKNMLDFDHSDYQKFQIWQAATDPLKEIERLQNG